MNMQVEKFNINNLRKPKISKNVMIFSVFLLLSIIFWFLNALEKEYTSEINFPIKFINFPSNKISVGKIPRQITIKLNGHGYDFIGNIRDLNNTININVKKLAIKKNNSKKSDIFYILTSSLRKKISLKTGSNTEIISIYPDSLILKLSDIISKKIPVIPEHKLNFKQMFMLNGKIILSPDSITVSGLKKNIDSIENVQTHYKEYSDINDTVIDNIQIITKNNIKYSHKNIKLTIPAEKYTENVLEIPIKVINLADTLKIITFPEKIKLTFRTGISNYKNIKVKDFEIIADYKTSISKERIKLKVELVKYPQNVKSIKLYPENIDYIIKRKK